MTYTNRARLTSEARDMSEVGIGDLTFLFSFETLVGFGIPGLGRVKVEAHGWSAKTRRHLAAWPAAYIVTHATFERYAEVVDAMLSAQISRTVAVRRIRGMIDGAE